MGYLSSIVKLNMRSNCIILMSAAMMLSYTTMNAQEQDRNDTLTKKEHSISRATIYSTVLPGLGQGYNKKYWKIPIIYAGFGVMTYFIVSNVKEFNKFKEAYIYTVNNETYPIDNDYVGKYTAAQLKDGMDTHRRYRDLSYIITALWYSLNILDANVDAHFFDYDISEDISLHWEPQIQQLNYPSYSGNYTTGVKLTFKF